MQYLTALLVSVQKLGPRRIALLGILMAVTIAMMSASFIMLNKPVKETLYSGLDAEDVNRIGSVLSEVGIAFDVNEAGNAVLVEYGKTAQARMILAEKGLPKSDKSGYELFDQMGSLGLTSFMQQVTRVRALEGELVRTIQELQGIKAARVHLAIKSETAFRNKDEKPSASVVVRTDGQPPTNTANSIRQIVAAAIPGLRPEQVTVMTTDGTLMTPAGYGENGEPDRMLELETRISSEARERIERTLGPIVGSNNIRVSVTSRVNTDQRQMTATKFDPESKVERSSKVSKTTDQSNNSANSQAVTTQQNVPQEVKDPVGGDNSNSKKEVKEETVNYEVNSEQTATVSKGFVVEKMSVAVVLNRQAMLKAQGATPDEAKLTQQLAEIDKVVRTAAGFDENRGDSVQVSAIDFIDDATAMEPVEAAGMMDTLKGNLGTIINALSLIVALVLVIMLGLRPALKMLVEKRDGGELPAPSMAEALAAPGADFAQGAGPMGGMPMGGGMGSGSMMDNIAAGLDPMAGGAGFSDSLNDPRNKLNKVVEIDVDRAAQVLKQWLDKPAARDAA